MSLDYTGFIYKMMMFESSLVGLTEEERAAAIHNMAIAQANEMAHSGIARALVQSHLNNNEADHLNTFVNWYSHGGETNSIKLVRKATEKHTGVKSKRPNLINGKEIHDHLVSDQALADMKRTHENTTKSLTEHGYHP